MYACMCVRVCACVWVWVCARVLARVRVCLCFIITYRIISSIIDPSIVLFIIGELFAIPYYVLNNDYTINHKGI